MLKYLRIAVTALCLTACVLLALLWVRSYWRLDSTIGPLSKTTGFQVSSMEGRIWLQYAAGLEAPVTSWEFFSRKESILGELEDDHPLNGPTFRVASNSGILEAVVPHWFLAIITAAIATVFWTSRKWRFSLRTLLIATTLVAVGLGMVVYLAR
jgi:hypothetical protein